LPEAEVRLRGYRTLTGDNGVAAGTAAARAVGASVLRRVPGFRREGAGWVFAAVPGLVVPVRDRDEAIVALKVRRDDAAGGPRYVYASSVRWGGPGPGSPVHVPLIPAPPLPPPNPGAIRITEGELKADIATVLSGVRTISVPGVASWRASLPVVQALGVRRVLVAFDADAARKPQVARARGALLSALVAETGVEPALEVWDERDGKGIDDLLAAGGHPHVVEGAALSDYVGQPGAKEPEHSCDRPLSELPPRIRLRLAVGDRREMRGGIVAAIRFGASRSALEAVVAQRCRALGSAAPEAEAREAVAWAFRVVGGERG
jgi:hypothetical protein